MFVKDGIPEVHFLPDMVPKALVMRFSNKYGVRIEYFFNPEMLESLSATKH